MSILEEIVAHKRKEVERQRERYPVKLLEESIFFGGPVVSLSKYLQRPDKEGIIAEIKRRSPSKGVLNPSVSIEELSIGYMQAGASALSVLTDSQYFGGSPEDLRVARRFNFCPILRKDFVIDEYQIVEARAIGADAVLLIAACLSPEDIRRLAAFARSLQLEVLLEVHSREELDRSLCDEVQLVGVNSRNLDTFEVLLRTAFDLAEHIPNRFVRVAESGIRSAENILELRKSGYHGFLIGEAFMTESRPASACRRLVRAVQQARSAQERAGNA